jgi:hypothetical protein
LTQSGRAGEVLLEAVAELRDRFGVSPVWVHEGKLVDPPLLLLEESFPDDLPTLGRTERERRHFRKCLAARRREPPIKAPRRQPDDYYKRLLAVWDAREGWLDQPSKGYDPDRALSLQMAVAKAGAGSCVEDYYRAFQLVTGQEYSMEAWLVTLGIFWLECSNECIRRRGTGRKRGGSSRKGEPVVRFLELLGTGLGIDEAARRAGLPDQAAKTLSDPSNRDAVLRFRECPKKVSQLIARL